jgi:hypothetical protein
VAKEIVEDFLRSLDNDKLDVRVYYNKELAGQGVASGNTILSLKIENRSNKGFNSVAVEFLHPEENLKVEQSPLKSLRSNNSKIIDFVLKLNSVGFHLLKDGLVKVETLSGLVQIYKFTKPIRIIAENSNASKHSNITSNQTLTTYGGGVIDGSNFQKKGTSELTITEKDKGPNAWELVPLIKINISENKDLAKSLTSTSKDTFNPNKIEETEISRDSSSIESIKTVDIKEEIIQNNPTSFNVDIGPEIRKLSKEDVTTLEITQSSKLEFIDLFAKHLFFLSKSQDPQKIDVYRPNHIDLSLIREIARACDIKRSDIAAVLTKSTNNHSDELQIISGEVTVIASQGILTIISKNDLIEVKEKYGWSFIDENKWALFKQSFSRNSLIASIGDEATDFSLPNLTFDLRKIKPGADVELLCSRIDYIFDLIKSLNKIITDNKKLTRNDRIEEFEDEDEDEENENFETDEEFEEQINEAENNCKIAIHNFFKTYAFASQYCDEKNDRLVHVFIEEEDGGDIGMELVDKIQELIPDTEILAICEEDLDSKHDKKSRLLSWVGLASLITTRGLYYVEGVGANKYKLIKKGSFIPWIDFFAKYDADLIVRESVPDLWIGSAKSKYFITGSYINYSNNINGWIYFNEYIYDELIDRFDILKEAIMEGI